jgi:SAM-dependent methyltransferase
MTDSDLESVDPVESTDWDAMYGAAEQVWSGNPNGVLVSELAGRAPGTAVDVGCGEGADAVWLARQGWQVTALDVSATALARAARQAADAGVQVDFVHAGLLDFDPRPARFDLVNVQYPGLLHEGGRSVSALLDLVAPGGTLLFVHHAELSGHAAHDHSEHTGPAGVDPADYVLPADVHAALGGDWIVEVFEERSRSVATGAGAGYTKDLVLKACRRGAAAGGSAAATPREPRAQQPR